MYPHCEGCAGNCDDKIECPCSEVAIFREDMIRHLFSRVSCEFRKGLKDFHKMPNVPGWTSYASRRCPICDSDLEPDSEYPDDLLCGNCNKVFDRETLVFVEVF
jgi:hypothetical protein